MISLNPIPYTLTPTKTRKRVFVGLSGGVDSAVSAALLKEQGHEVTGVFIRTWHPEGFPCTEPEDEREAMRVAAHLGIPFRTLDLSERYKKEVGDLMINGYARGETPNPDVLCNREVKFGGFVDFAKREGADAIATGHYARLAYTEGGISLMCASDTEKDQSYFLGLVPDEQLAFAQFPIGHLHKAQVRALADRFALPNAKRKDSQGICFLGALDLREFLSAYIPLQEGVVLSPEGKAIGTHTGAPLFTVGERHGFTVHATQTNAEPLYVLATDIVSNTITVGPKKLLTGSRTLTLREVVVHGDIPEEGSLEAQVRYHGSRHAVSAVFETSGHAHLTFREGVVVARGQTVALYQGSRLVAAGIVDVLA